MATYGELAERLDITVHTPNEQVFGRLLGEYDITIWFHPGYPERVGDQEIAGQLGKLSRLLFAARAAGLRRIEIETLGAPWQPRKSERREEFERRYADIAVTESSPDGSVSVSVVGLSSFAWTIAPGSVDRLGTDGLGQVATDLANRVVAALRDAVRQLNVEVFHQHG